MGSLVLHRITNIIVNRIEVESKDFDNDFEDKFEEEKPTVNNQSVDIIKGIRQKHVGILYISYFVRFYTLREILGK